MRFSFLRLNFFLCATLVLSSLLVTKEAEANPVFARQTNLSCAACHAAYPRLNSFGEAFLAGNIRLPGWKEQIGTDTGDDMLVLPKMPQVGFRVQGYAQARSADVIDSSTGKTVQEADYDIQAPYLIKLFSAAPLSDNISYYFYAMMAEKGSNGEILVEDAWLNYSDLFGTGVGMMAGQFQLSDLMFPRETRLTFQDFIPYRMAGITYDRGVSFTRGVGPIKVDFGVSNGNGIDQQATLNSAGYNRPDHAFDNNRSKTFFGRLGADMGPVNGGFFFADGKRENAAGTGVSDSQVIGVDFSQSINEEIFWFAQYLQVTWDDFLSKGKSAEWSGGFAGLDYVYSSRWVFSGLYNYADANDLKDSGTVYEGIALNSFTGAVSYYFMRNVKMLVEANYDMQATDANDGVGHDTKEHYMLVGFDLAF